jgi:hypothetical protein
MTRKHEGSHTGAHQGEPWPPDPPRAARAAGRAPALPRQDLDRARNPSVGGHGRYHDATY